MTNKPKGDTTRASARSLAAIILIAGYARLYWARGLNRYIPLPIASKEMALTGCSLTFLKSPQAGVEPDNYAAVVRGGGKALNRQGNDHRVRPRSLDACGCRARAPHQAA